LIAQPAPPLCEATTQWTKGLGPPGMLSLMAAPVAAPGPALARVIVKPIGEPASTLAASWTFVRVRLGVTTVKHSVPLLVWVGLVPPGLTWVTIVGGTRTADAFSERSWLPIEVVSIWMIRWWYGEPLMFIALVPTPQFCWVAIWPPQASTKSPPAVVVNVTCT